MWFFGEGTKRAKEGKAAERGEETRRRETVGTVRWQRPERQAALLSEPADRGPPYQISSTIISLILLRIRPAHWKSNNYGTRLNTP